MTQGHTRYSDHKCPPNTFPKCAHVATPRTYSARPSHQRSSPGRRYQGVAIAQAVAHEASTSGREHGNRSEQKYDLAKQQQAVSNGALDRAEQGKFVQFFRMASPYIEGHRGRTFVIVLPGEVSTSISLPIWLGSEETLSVFPT
jgi:hypothetical protein